ncbi:DegT/DnrJ/EryC1/StrS family aminotransferase [Chelatococcus asaccharovorans]|uniref:DegT/DnrJ/EryC1/StrS family aminotransferase n=1 Tax=Chelatococcus asaccharovorans TaxID=28210 RepID=UPI00224C68BE|nr:DegT/DnrJ/EryC1/StrS family aminotransferase [Chelatococcus asaccharovorans]CAH1668185.1 Pleiotropic regulatory protein [Chelatococcus asaccharovorans]CAH1680313.1 Pleiotropic regulatory protein [Chelatococcus asaccharovorans]
MIPLLDLKAQYATIATELESAALAVLRSGSYVLGSPVADFERNFAAYCGVAEAVGVSSGTAALHLALEAAGVGAGHEVITTPLTFVATVAAIAYCGARPVLVDIDAESLTLDPARIEAAITPRTRAIMPVHLHGRLADMEAIGAIARRHGLLVIEDAAQAHGAERDGRRAGAFGDIGCFSFYPGKNLGACGEGGAIVTKRADLAEAVRCLRDWGQAGKYNHIRKGYNFRLDAIQAALLDVKLRHLSHWTEDRRRIADAYHRGLASSDVGLPAQAGRDHVHHVFAIRAPARDALAAALRQEGVATGIHYPRPVHLQPAYADLGYREGDFPVAEAIARDTLSLPIYPELTPDQVDHVIAAVRRACAASRSPVRADRSRSSQWREDAGPADSLAFRSPHIPDGAPIIDEVCDARRSA